MSAFTTQLLAWVEHHGRKDLPWQQNPTPYRVWVSEVMLQQTQVATVIDYYRRFMALFPDVRALAEAPLDSVLHQWTGLGYYARARNLHRAARTIVAEHGGELPTNQEGLESLPGIGASTAGAIQALAMARYGVILDGNVKRVLSRYHGVVGHYSERAVLQRLWHLATEHTPTQQTAAYTQAIMDLGATVCTRKNPGCHHCPVREGCLALAAGQVHELPTTRKAKAKPVRESRFFVVTLAEGQVLLEQRPSKGLWGGLWNPLERGVETTVETLLDEIGASPSSLDQHQTGIRFRHTFTHFHLDIEVHHLQLNARPSGVAGGDMAWVELDQLANQEAKIGLSAAALKMLEPLLTEDLFRAPSKTRRANIK